MICRQAVNASQDEDAMPVIRDEDQMHAGFKKACPSGYSVWARRGGLEKTFAVGRVMPVKLVVAVRLVPDAAQEAALWDTLALCNKAANYASARAFATRVTRMQPLQRLVYGDLKAMGLSAQPAIHVARRSPAPTPR
jgi:hypothetical protein